MKKRIYLNMLLLTFLSVFLVSSSLVFIFYTKFSNQVTSELKSKAIFIENILNQNDNNIKFMQSINLPLSDIRISIISQKGTVLYDNMSNSAKMENHLHREEVVEALKYGTGESKRFSNTLGMETYYYSKKLSDGTILRVSKTINSIYNMFLNSLYVSIFIILLILILNHFLAKNLTKKIIEPINNINLNTTEAVYDELSPLIRTITHQRSEIETHLHEVKSKAETITAISENMKEGIILIDKNGTILSANKSASNIFNLTVPIGKNIVEISRNVEIIEHAKSALKGIRSDITTNIAGCVYSTFFSPVPDNGAIILLLDITERVQSEKIRREFSANVSHELKTPLTSISGYAEMLENNMVKSDDINLFAGKIKDESTRLLNLIDDIIMLSRLDETEDKNDFEAIDLSAIVDEVMENLKSKAQKSKVSLKATIEPVTVKANKQMMFELLYNLTDNAIKYNKTDGLVNISVSNEQGKVKIIISDTGIGIPNQHINRIFERFYRIDKSHSKKTGGTGLGLSIVKHIVNYHEGTIEIDSSEGIGTNITIML